MILFTLPLKTVNPLNRREHWAVRARRTRAQRLTARACTNAVWPPIWRKGEPTPTLLLTRLAPRKMDIHDGVPAACKPIVDGIADALGVDDQHLSIRYAQEKSSIYGVRVEAVE